MGWLASLRRPNAALWWVLASTACLLALVVGVPSLRNLFGFALPPAAAWGLATVAGVTLLPLLGWLARRLQTADFVASTPRTRHPSQG